MTKGDKQAGQGTSSSLRTLSRRACCLLTAHTLLRPLPSRSCRPGPAARQRAPDVCPLPAVVPLCPAARPKVDQGQARARPALRLRQQAGAPLVRPSRGVSLLTRSSRSLPTRRCCRRRTRASPRSTSSEAPLGRRSLSSPSLASLRPGLTVASCSCALLVHRLRPCLRFHALPFDDCSAVRQMRMRCRRARMSRDSLEAAMHRAGRRMTSEHFGGGGPPRPHQTVSPRLTPLSSNWPLPPPAAPPALRCRSTRASNWRCSSALARLSLSIGVRSSEMLG